MQIGVTRIQKFSEKGTESGLRSGNEVPQNLEQNVKLLENLDLIGTGRDGILFCAYALL